METNISASHGSSIDFALRDASALTVQASQHLREGMDQLNMGEPAAALVAFNSALEHAPDFPDAHVGAGIAYAMTSQIYPAIDHLTRATELDPHNFYGHFKLTQLYFKLRVPAKGYECAGRALECDRTYDERRMISQLLWHERQREREGIARPWFYKTFSRPWMWAAATGMAAVLVALLRHMH